jgi:hypothetical protein
MTQSPAPLDFNIPLDLKAVYSNLVRITHSPADLVFDFTEMLPGYAMPQMVARVLMSPVGAKLLHRALGENLARYEAAFGEIHLPGEANLAGDLFGRIHPPPPEA